MPRAASFAWSVASVHAPEAVPELLALEVLLALLEEEPDPELLLVAPDVVPELLVVVLPELPDEEVPVALPVPELWPVLPPPVPEAPEPQAAAMATQGARTAKR
jgi:hypothetical protein